MAFELYKLDHGAVVPLEYLQAEEGTYEPGQALTIKDGKLSAITEDAAGIPPYISHAAKTIAEGAEGDAAILPVTHTTHDGIYMSVLEATEVGAKVGAAMKVKTGGLSPTGTGGSFELTYVDGTAAGDYVLGRFVPQAAAAAG